MFQVCSLSMLYYNIKFQDSLKCYGTFLPIPFQSASTETIFTEVNYVFREFHKYTIGSLIV